MRKISDCNRKSSQLVIFINKYVEKKFKLQRFIFLLTDRSYLSTSIALILQTIKVNTNVWSQIEGGLKASLIFYFWKGCCIKRSFIRSHIITPHQWNEDHSNFPIWHCQEVALCFLRLAVEAPESERWWSKSHDKIWKYHITHRFFSSFLLRIFNFCTKETNQFGEEVNEGTFIYKKALAHTHGIVQPLFGTQQICLAVKKWRTKSRGWCTQKIHSKSMKRKRVRG